MTSFVDFAVEFYFAEVGSVCEDFFDAVDAAFKGSLTYPGIEKRDDVEKHPTAVKDVKNTVNELLKPFLTRKKVMFVCPDNACLSQMASAYAQCLGGHTFDIVGGGLHPADKINPTMQQIMQEDGIDMAFRQPQSLDVAVDGKSLDCVITMGDNIPTQLPVSASTQHWDLPDPIGKQMDFMRELQIDIKSRVTKLISQLTSDQPG